MKRILLIFLIILFTTGCSQIMNLNKTDTDKIINNTLNSKYDLTNHINKGFKYYLPRDLKVLKTDEANEIIKDENYEYYLYVDLISFYNKKDFTYEKDDIAYYSYLLLKDDKKGVINVYNSADECFIKATYNYATIEVKINLVDLNEALSNIMIVLSSIDYNEDVIKSILSNDSKVSKDEVVNVFDSKKNDNTSLDVEEDEYTGNEEEDYDPDVIN